MVRNPSPGESCQEITILKPDPELVALVTELTKCVAALTKMTEALVYPITIVKTE